MIFCLTKLMFLKKQLFGCLMTPNKNLKSKDYIFNSNQFKSVTFWEIWERITVYNIQQLTQLFADSEQNRFWPAMAWSNYVYIKMLHVLQVCLSYSHRGTHWWKYDELNRQGMLEKSSNLITREQGFWNEEGVGVGGGGGGDL